MAYNALNQLISQSLMNSGLQNNGLNQAIGAATQKSPAWKAMQAADTEAAAQAGLPVITSFTEEAPARARLQDAISRLQSTGIKIPYFIGTPNEPTGDRGVTMDMENLVNGLKILEKQASQVGDKGALSNISKERQFWENQITEGMSAEEWKSQTGENDPVYQ